ncbi:hypothetical protein ACFU8W_22615 [Streptomyces sp. NPDC057565]|uniref:hypothetical protein n=1 Tax=Streptomyces sp. NPDC057565 TaxID=3346169 RepID=UPI0036C4AB0D
MRDSDVHGQTFSVCLAGGSVDPVTRAVIQYTLDCNQNKYSRAAVLCDGRVGVEAVVVGLGVHPHPVEGGHGIQCHQNPVAG